MMNYKLIEGSANDVYSPVQTFLVNRGIVDWREYLNLTDRAIQPPDALNNMVEAVECFASHCEKNSNFHIVCDSDVDGYTSAAMLYNYIKNCLGKNVSYSLHTEKQHGLSDIDIPSGTNIVIVPDAGTNDVNQCKELNEKGIQVIILDHHIQEQDNPFAIIVNSNNNYPNPSLSGAGVTYKFIQACDEYFWTHFSERVVDLVALGLVGDVSDMRFPETRRICDIGLSHVQNPLFKALLDKQLFKIGNDITIQNIQFYVVPLINAIIRFGDQLEKDLLFKALAEINETFEHRKRGGKESIQETIYERVTRLASNAKSRQDRAVLKAVNYCDEVIERYGLNNNKILFVDTKDKTPHVLNGTIASKLADKYAKPCLVIRQFGDTFKGSGRNYRHGPVDSLKDLLVKTEVFDEVIGHDNAFGCAIHKDNCVKAIKSINKTLFNYSNSKIEYVDFDVEFDEIDVSLIKEVDGMKHLYGPGVEDPLFHIRGIPLNCDEVSVIGKQLNTWRYMDEESGISYVKFQCDYNDIILTTLNSLEEEWGLSNNNIIRINAICTLGINNYNSILTPQVIVKQYERVE